MSRPRVERLALSDPDLYLQGVPYDYFRELRDHEPVAWHEDCGGYWVLTRYDDVVAANRDWRTYSNAQPVSSIEDPATPEEIEARQRIFVNQDPPRHDRLRKLVSPAFTPRAVRELTPMIERMCSSLVDRLLDGEVHDMVTIGEELAFQMVATLFGLPEADWPMVLDWTRRITNFQEPALNPDLASRHEASRDAVAYATELIASVRRDPAAHTGIVAALAASTIVDEQGNVDRLSDAELASFFGVTVTGGVETTAHTLAEAALAFAERPEIFDVIGATGACPPAYLEELLRWRGTVLNFRRTATVDHELQGVTVRAGDKVLLQFQSANRDERHFANPDVFDPTRTPNDHVAFGGGGPHFCLGAQLARLDLRLMFGELFGRVAELEVTSTPQRLRANQFAGWLHVPVRARAR
jgi:cholest-4-en-3-one 26-monooxygenase